MALLDYQEEPKGRKVFLAFGAMCFIAVTVFTFIHKGFITERFAKHMEFKQFLTPLQLWLMNAGLGIVGGILFNHKKMILAAVAGLVAALSMTGVTMFYVSWRTSVYNYEMLVPLFVGMIPGFLVYGLLSQKKKTES